MIPVANVIHAHDIYILSYANDMQLIFSLSDKTSHTRNKFPACMTEVTKWRNPTVSSGTLTRQKL